MLAPMKFDQTYWFLSCSMNYITSSCRTHGLIHNLRDQGTALIVANRSSEDFDLVAERKMREEHHAVRTIAHKQCLSSSIV